MLSRRHLRLAAVLLLPLAAMPASARERGGGAKTNTRYVARDVETLYAQAKTLLDRRQYKEAAAYFDEVERQHPYSVWARRAQLMSAFAYWSNRDYSQAISSSQRFLALHPGYKDAPYAYYLIAVSYYEQINDVQHDQKTSAQALDALTELIRRYPTTPYAADARLKIDLVRDHLAGKEMEIGRFYQSRKLWLASVLRFRTVVDTYDTTSHTPEALERLVESYLAIGLKDEAKKAASVLSFNYPGSEWNERAYALMQRHKLT